MFHTASAWRGLSRLLATALSVLLVLAVSSCGIVEQIQGATATAVALVEQATQTAQHEATATGVARAEATATQVVASTATAQYQTQITATGAAQATQRAERRAQGTATAEAQAALAEGIRVANNIPADWPSIFIDPFVGKTGRGNWYISNFADDLSIGKSEIIDGVYRWDVHAQDGVIMWSWAATPRLSDVAVSVDGIKVSGPADSEYGLIFRYVDEDNFYAFSLDSDKYVYIYMQHRGEWRYIFSGLSSAIDPYQHNRLTVIAEGSRFTFYINQKYVTQVFDSRLERGFVGVCVAVYTKGESASFEFDDFAVFAP